jgi:hypothetical protein
MGWGDVTDKFLRQSNNLIDDALAQRIIEKTKLIEHEKDISQFAEMLGG